MGDASTTLADLKELVAAFIRARDWEQFHTPKNLAMSVAIEAAELMEHYQWLTPEASLAATSDAATCTAVADELADVLCYLLSFSNATGIDLADAVRRKLVHNAAKYPADQVRGHYRRPER